MKIDYEPPLSTIKDFRRNWRGANHSSEFYLVARSLDGDLGTGYVGTLPKFKGKTFVQHLQERYSQGDQEIDVLDIGCGQGRALIELSQRFPSIKLHGVSADDYRPRLPKNLKPLAENIDYRIGDAHRLRNIFGDVRFDLIVSVCTFHYLPDPQGVLRQAYGLLKDSGMAFIHEPCIPLTFEEVKQLRRYWRLNGVDAKLESHGPMPYEGIELFDIAVRKTVPKLLLPFNYCIIEDRTLSYKLNQQEVSPKSLLVTR